MESLQRYILCIGLISLTHGDDTCADGAVCHGAKTLGAVMLQKNTAVSKDKAMDEYDYEAMDEYDYEENTSAATGDEKISGDCDCEAFCAMEPSDTVLMEQRGPVIDWVFSWRRRDSTPAPTETWEANSSKYKIGEVASNGCPPDSFKMDNADECARAAAELKLTWNKEFNDTDYPTACSKWGTWVYFNTAAAGKGVAAYETICSLEPGSSRCASCDCSQMSRRSEEGAGDDEYYDLDYADYTGNASEGDLGDYDVSNAAGDEDDLDEVAEAAGIDYADVESDLDYGGTDDAAGGGEQDSSRGDMEDYGGVLDYAGA